LNETVGVINAGYPNTFYDSMVNWSISYCIVGQAGQSLTS